MILATRADGQTTAASVAPSLKLTGVAVKATPQGYFVVSVPTADIPKVLKFIAHFEPHMAMLEMMERVSSAAVRANRMVSRTPEVGNGLVFLATSEVFPTRHKVINRFVRRVGIYTYINSRGADAAVVAYAGGPIVR